MQSETGAMHSVFLVGRTLANRVNRGNPACTKGCIRTDLQL